MRQRPIRETSWNINNQETRQTCIYHAAMHYYHIIIDATIQHLYSVRGPLSACLKITDPPCRHDLRTSKIWCPDEFPDIFDFVSCQECLLQGWAHTSTPSHTSTPLSTWKNVARGLRPWRCVLNRNLCLCHLCHLCPRWCQRSLWNLWCRSHITSYLESLLVLWVWIFAFHNPVYSLNFLCFSIFEGVGRSGSQEIDLSSVCGTPFLARTYLSK